VSHKPIVPSVSARRDVEEAIDHYLREASSKTALAFIADLERAYRHLSRHPAAGSPRYAYELDLPDLRSWMLRRFPYLVFYVERDDHIEVWRVLHGERDIPAWMREL
jgi:toxin ParE1/3/4